MATWLWIVIIVVVLAIVLAAVMAARRRRTMALRQRFGTEYDRTLDARDGQRAAEADLRDRERERGRHVAHRHQPLAAGQRGLPKVDRLEVILDGARREH